MSKRKKKPKKIGWLIFALILVVIGAGCCFIDWNSIGINLGGTGNSPCDVVVDDILNFKVKGGFNRLDVKTAEEDINCPVVDDKYFDISMFETSLFVTFYYDTYDEKTNQIITPNVIFMKTDNGLAFVGCYNVKIDYYNNKTFVTEFYRSKDLFLNRTDNSFWNDPSGLKSYIYIDDNSDIDDIAGWNLIGQFFSLFTRNEINVNAWKGCLGVLQDYFSNFNGVEITTMNENLELSLKDYHNFFSSVYSSVKSYGNNCCVDITDMTSYIDNDDVIYKCNRYFVVKYIDKISQYSDVGYKKRARDNMDVVNSFVIEKTNLPTTAFVKISLNNSNNSDLSSFDITTSPVLIELSNTTKTYSFGFDTIDEFKNGIGQSVELGTYNCTIRSNGLDFGGTTSTIEIKKDEINFKFDYTYNGGFVNAKIKLNKLSNFNLSDVDIATNNVTLTLFNTNDTHTFVFDSDEDFTNGISKSIKIGTYNYTIVSNALLFDNYSGSVEISFDKKEYLYNCDFEVINNVDYELVFVNKSKLFNTSFDYFYIDTSIIQDIKSFQFLYFYTLDDEIVQHTVVSQLHPTEPNLYVVCLNCDDYVNLSLKCVFTLNNDVICETSFCDVELYSVKGSYRFEINTVE